MRAYITLAIMLFLVWAIGFINGSEWNEWKRKKTK